MCLESRKSKPSEPESCLSLRWKQSESTPHGISAVVLSASRVTALSFALYTGSSKHSKSASPSESPPSNDKDTGKRSKSTGKDKSDLAKPEKTSGGKKV